MRCYFQKMSLPKFIDAVLLKPEQLGDKIKALRALHPEFADVADLATMTLGSSSTNDYLEKIGAESIGFIHLDDKLGADGVSPTDDRMKLEVKPTKANMVAVINDDTPMKLIKSDSEIPLILFLNASKKGDTVNWALLAPFSAWTEERYKEIAKNLDVGSSEGWKWSLDSLPKDTVQRRQCLEDLVKKHIPKRYVRGNPLKFEVILGLKDSQLRFWKNPNYKGKIPAAMKRFL